MENLQRIVKAKRRSQGRELIELHHKLMKAYGWISLEDLKKMPIPMMLNLNELIDRDNREQEKQYRKMKQKAKRKR